MILERDLEDGFKVWFGYGELNSILQVGGVTPADLNWSFPPHDMLHCSYRWLFGCVVSISLTLNEFVAQRDMLIDLTRSSLLI
jgi:hypothetical protein